MYGRKRYPSMYWLLMQAAIVLSYANLSYSKPYRQEIYQKDKNNNQENNKTILHVTNNPSEHLAHLDKIALDPSLNSRTQLLENNKDNYKTNAGAPLLQESVIFKAIVSNADVLTLQEENSSSNGVLSKHSTETQQEHKDGNGSSSSSHERPSKAHLKWDGHVVAAPLKYDPHASNFQTPKKVSDTVSTSKMVLSLLTAAAALGSICLTVAIFQCCCRRKRTSDDEEDDGQIESDQCNKEKATVKPVDTQEQQTVEPETSDKNVCIQKTDAPVETETEPTTTNGEAVQKDSEEKEEEQVSVKDKIKAFETQALKPFIAENVEQHRPLIKRPQSRVIADNTESEALSANTTLIMGQVFRKRADTDKVQRKESSSAQVNTKTDDDYFGMIGRETEVLKSYRRAPAPRNRNKATKALYRKTMPIMDSGGKPKMDISMSDWEATVQSFHQTESPSPLVKQESKKKIAVRLPMANQKAKEEVDNKQEEDLNETAKAETKTEGSMMETVPAADTEKLGSAPSTGNNTPDAGSSGDEASQGEERKIKEEMKEETNKEEDEVVKVELKKEEEDVEEEEGELKEKFKKEEEEEVEEKEEEKEEMKKEEEEKEKQKNEAEQKEEEKEEETKLKEEEEEKLKEEEVNKEKKEKDEEPEEKETETELKKEKETKTKKEKETKSKKEKEKLLKKEKELKKREKDEVKREKEELNKEELKKGKEQFEKEVDKNENIFFQIDPTAEPTAAKLVKRDSGHESSETGVQIRQKGGDSPKNDQSPKSKRHLSHLDRSSMFMLPGQKPEDQMSLMLSLKEKLNDKKEKNELDADADTDTKMDVDPEPETEKSELPEC